jgi:hypothetical protein
MKLLMLSLLFLSLAPAAHARAMSISCALKLQQITSQQVIFYYRGNIVIGESIWDSKPIASTDKKTVTSHGFLRIYSTAHHTLGAPLAFGESTANPHLDAITSGAVAGDKMYIGGADGIFAGTDFNKWEHIPGVTGGVTKMLAADGDIWAVDEKAIIRLHSGRVIYSHTYTGAAVVIFVRSAGKIVFVTIDPAHTTRKLGACGEQLDLSAPQALDINSGEPVSVSTEDATAANFPDFIPSWLAENSGNKNAANDLAGLAEKLYAQQNYENHFAFWIDIFQWLHDNKDYARIKRMYLAASSGNKHHLLYLGYGKDRFALELATLAVEQHDYCGELLSILTRHTEPEYDELLARMVRECAALKLDKPGGSTPYEDAAAELLRRQGEKAVPLIKKVKDAPDTLPENKTTLENILHSRGYN